MNEAAPDVGLKAFATVGACVVNTLIFVGMAAAGLLDDPPPPELPAMMAELVELPKLGTKEPDPKALPRIVEPAPPPPPKVDEIKLSREKEEAEEREREEKRKLELAEKQRQEELERKKQEDLERKRQEDEERKRKKAMERALARATDVRADNEDDPGFAAGHAQGTSTDPESLKNKLVYLSLVEAALRSQFEVPMTIPPDVLKRLECVVAFRLDKEGKVVGEPRLTKTSGNKDFDEAALSAVRKFKPGSRLRIPLPTDNEGLKATVLREGLKPTMQGRKL